mgnify:CR=1 FL=1
MTTQTTDRATDVQRAKDLIRAFFALAPTSLTSARHDDVEVDAWRLLRAYLRSDYDACAAYLGDEIRLHADAPMFRDGVRVTLTHAVAQSPASQRARR